MLTIFSPQSRGSFANSINIDPLSPRQAQERLGLPLGPPNRGPHQPRVVSLRLALDPRRTAAFAVAREGHVGSRGANRFGPSCAPDVSFQISKADAVIKVTGVRVASSQFLS